MSVELAPLAPLANVASPPNCDHESLPVNGGSGRIKSPPSYTRRILRALSFIAVGLLVAALLIRTAGMKTKSHVMTSASSGANSTLSSPSPPTMAFCGNSMLYYNDCPRLVEIMLSRLWLNRQKQNDNSEVPLRVQDSCLRGGANLASLWAEGNGMQSRFGHDINDSNSSRDAEASEDIGAVTVQSLLDNPPPSAAAADGGCWNFVLLQDDEQYAIQASMSGGQTISTKALRESYLPTIKQPSNSSTCKERPTILLLQTFAYESPRLRETIGLGGLDEFTNALVEGYEVYASIIQNEFGLDCRIVPMATAVRRLSDELDNDLWGKMYNWDEVHPSPHATWLQTCLIVAVAMGRAPPVWDNVIRSSWQSRARYWQKRHEGQQLLPLPSDEEAEALRLLACRLVLTSKDPCY